MFQSVAVAGKAEQIRPTQENDEVVGEEDNEDSQESTEDEQEEDETNNIGFDD